MIPSVASVISIENPFFDSPDISLAQPLAAVCIPSFVIPFEETRRFKWNVENFIHKKMNFSYYVGEGPLYWYRIDWYPKRCSPNPCIEVDPIISYIAPNCPYEIIERCLVLPPSCDCAISCEPGECISQTIEVWHMLATSVIHLCERINQECCHRRPDGYMRRVRQYMRPALCCDVAEHGRGSDEYKDVNFFKCECGNLVDPCLAIIIYPCHVNRCGINGSAFGGGPVPPISAIKLAPDILSHMPMPIASQDVEAMPKAVEIVPPKEAQPVNRIVNKFGPSIPELIRCKHNLGETDIFKDFLRMHKTKFDTLDLFYNKGHNAWQGSKNFKDWKVMLEWVPTEGSGYKLNMIVDKMVGGKAVKTKASLSVKNESFTNEKGVFEVLCDYNTKTGTLSSKKSILQSKVIKDDIGLFKSGWKGNFILKG